MCNVFQVKSEGGLHMFFVTCTVGVMFYMIKIYF